MCFGGTFFEVCLRQGKLDEFLALVDECEHDLRGDLRRHHRHGRGRQARASSATLSKRYKVLSEVGSKDDAVVITPSKWVELIGREIEAGAWKVITEGRESGTVGIYRPSGDVKDGLLEEIRNNFDTAAAPVRGADQEAAGLVHQAVRQPT